MERLRLSYDFDLVYVISVIFIIFNMEIKEKIFKVIIKPNSLTNEIRGFDKDKNAYLVSIKARPANNKANIELMKFLSKVLVKKVKIKSGFKSKEKIIEALKE